MLQGRETPTAKIGCIALLQAYDDRMFAIDCKKGRGLVFPGGRWEPDKDRSYVNTAIREAKEEAGFDLAEGYSTYMFDGPDGFGWHVYAFYFWNFPIAKPEFESDEGRLVIATWDQLFEKSQYSHVYRLIHHLMRERRLI